MSLWNNLVDVVESVDPFTGFGAATGRGYTGGAINRGVSNLFKKPSVDTTAADTESQILAEQLQNWEEVYKPVEQSLLQQSSLNNPSILTNSVNSAEKSAGQTYDTMAGVLSRQLRSQGIVPTQQQSQVSNRILNLSRAGAVAGAANTARRNVAAQDEAIALGTAPNPNLIRGV